MKILLANSPLRYYMTTSFMHPDWPALNLPQLAAMVWHENEEESFGQLARLVW